MTICEEDHRGITVAVTPEASGRPDQRLDFGRRQVLPTASFGVGLLWRWGHRKRTFPKTMNDPVFVVDLYAKPCQKSGQATFPKIGVLGKVSSGFHLSRQRRTPSVIPTPSGRRLPCRPRSRPAAPVAQLLPLGVRNCCPELPPSVRKPFRQFPNTPPDTRPQTYGFGQGRRTLDSIFRRPFGASAGRADCRHPGFPGATFSQPPLTLDGR